MSDVFSMGQEPSLGGLRPLAPDFNPSELGGTFSGLDDELITAPYRAALGGAAAVNLVAAPVAGLFGRDAQDKWFTNMVDAPLRSLEELDQKSQINGTAARVIGQLSTIVLEAPLGPVGVGALEGAKRFGLEERAGNDDAVALGVVTGATLSIGFALPLALPVVRGWGPAVLQRVSYGVGSNVALGASQRAAEGALGEDVRVLDGTAIALDTALGAFFGAAGHAYLRLTGEKAPAGPTPEQTQPAADAAMTMLEQASAQRVVPPGEPPQPYMAHLTAKEKAMQTGQELADPPVPASVAKLVNDEATAAEAVFRDAEPELARMDEPGAGDPFPIYHKDSTRRAALQEAKPAETWAPVNVDGEAVPLDLATLQQSAAQMDALGLKADDGRSYSEILTAAAKSPEDAAALLEQVTQCALNYGN